MLATQTLPQQRPGTMAVTVDGELPAGVTAKDVDPRHHRPHRHRRRHRLGHRVPGLGHPRPVDGGPHDRVQHVDRGRRQGRAHRPRRHDVRLPRGPPPRPDGRGVGAGARRLAQPAHRRRRHLRQGGRPRRRRRSCPTCRGAPTPPRSSPSTAPSPTPTSFAEAAERDAAGRALDYMGLDRRHADARHRRSTPCSSARAPTAASRTCGPRPPSPRAARWPTACAPWSCPARHAVKAQAEAEGLDKVLHRRRLRLARARAARCAWP